MIAKSHGRAAASFGICWTAGHARSDSDSTWRTSSTANSGVCRCPRPRPILRVGEGPDEAEVDFPNGGAVDGLVTMISNPANSARAVRRGHAGRTDVAEAIAPYLVAYYPSQLFQALTDGLLLFAIVAIVWLKPRNPGVVSGWFLMGYGVMRIVSEQFRAQYTTEWGVSSIWPAAGSCRHDRMGL